MPRVLVPCVCVLLSWLHWGSCTMHEVRLLARPRGGGQSPVPGGAMGHDSRSVADTKYNIAVAHEAQGSLEEARKLYLESAEIYAAVLGPDHEETLDARHRAQTVIGGRRRRESQNLRVKYLTPM